MIGYDLDGVLRDDYWPVRDKPYPKQTARERQDYDESVRVYLIGAECLWVPSADEPYVIITGCNAKFTDVTMEWLGRHGFENFAIAFIDRARTRRNMIAFKAEKIQEYGVTTFYEDDPAIARALERRCPGLQVVLVGNNW